jgi:hypothetical protein
MVHFNDGDVALSLVGRASSIACRDVVLESLSAFVLSAAAST